MPHPPRQILHLDMDAFFASIEQRDRPELRGKPVVVGADPDKRGVVSTASYEARAFGIRSAMPSRTAYRLCPEAVFVRPRMRHYAEVSDQLMAILESFTPDVEPVSVDEAFLDLGGVLHFWPDAETLARAVKEAIRRKLALTASAGLAGNKFLAKLGSDLHKPDGLTRVPTEPGAIAAFLAPLPTSRLFGVGATAAERLAQHGIRTIGQVQQTAETALAALVGVRFARHLRELAFGRDDRPLVLAWEEKSVSHETTFETDCADPEILRQTLVELAEQVGRRLRRLGKQARTVQIKIRFPDFKTLTRQTGLPAGEETDRGLIRAALALYTKESPQGPIRLLGFGATHLEPAGRATAPRQGDLFAADPPPERAARDMRLDQAVDALREKYGRQILKRGRPPA